MIGSSLFIPLQASFIGGLFIGIIITSSYYKKRLQDKSTSGGEKQQGKDDK
jgi:hypothetical protein